VARFSLRALMLAVTAICIVTAFSAHHLRWINQRRDYMLNSQYGPGWKTDPSLVGVSRRTVEKNSPSFSDQGAPYLLWLFGERRAVSIWVTVDANDVTRTGPDTATIKRSHPKVRHVMSLFPECQEFTITCNEMHENTVELVD